MKTKESAPVPAQTKEQAIKKLFRQAEEMREHAKKHALQVFIFHEATDHKVALDGHYSEEMLVNIAAHLGMNHPSSVRRARMVMQEVMGRKEVEKIEAEAEASVILGMDGKPMKAAEA